MNPLRSLSLSSLYQSHRFCLIFLESISLCSQGSGTLIWCLKEDKKNLSRSFGKALWFFFLCISEYFFVEAALCSPSCALSQQQDAAASEVYVHNTDVSSGLDQFSYFCFLVQLPANKHVWPAGKLEARVTFPLRGFLQKLNSSFYSITLSFLLSPACQSRRNYRKTVQIRTREPSEAEFQSQFLKCHGDAKANMNTVGQIWGDFAEQDFSSLQYGFVQLHHCAPKEP